MKREAIHLQRIRFLIQWRSPITALVLILSLLTASVSLVANAHALPADGNVLHSTAHSIGAKKGP